MSSLEKLAKAKSILEKELSIQVKNLNFEPKLARIHIILRDNIQTFVRYNNYDEYSYNIIFSKKELDRCRFDNYDDKWEVKSKPHHFHPRSEKEGFSSPMIGDPEIDIPNLCKLIKSGTLLNKEYRFKIK